MFDKIVKSLNCKFQEFNKFHHPHPNPCPGILDETLWTLHSALHHTAYVHRGETELRGEGRSRYNGDDAPLESPNFTQIAISMSSKKLVACISRYFHVWRIKMYPKQAK